MDKRLSGRLQHIGEVVHDPLLPALEAPLVHSVPPGVGNLCRPPSSTSAQMWLPSAVFSGEQSKDDEREKQCRLAIISMHHNWMVCMQCALWYEVIHQPCWAQVPECTTVNKSKKQQPNIRGVLL